KRSDIVVAVGHVPAESDSDRRARSGDLPRLARGVPGVAAWFGGHSHHLVVDRGDGTPILIAGSPGEAGAGFRLGIGPLANKVLESRTRLVRTYADEVTPDSAMAARVARWNEAVAPIANVRVGTNARTLRRGRGGESTVGDLVADAIRAAAGSDFS